MGWKDLFKSKPPDLKPDPRLRWFGKLPTYADYYSSAADADWVVEFNDWLLKGCELHFSRQPAAKREMHLQTVSGILRLPKSGMTVFASIQDYGGDTRGRPFPIAFYVATPTAAWPGPTGDRVLPGLRVLSDLLLTRDLVVRFVNAPARFEGVFGGRTIDLAGLAAEAGDTSWRTAAQTTPMDSWFSQAAACLKDGDAASWCAAVASWGGNIAKLESENFDPTLRLPLVMSRRVAPLARPADKRGAAFSFASDSKRFGPRHWAPDGHRTGSDAGGLPALYPAVFDLEVRGRRLCARRSTRG